MNREESMKQLKERYDQISPFLNEQSRRIWCAVESLQFEYGGISYVSKALGVARNTIYQGRKELNETPQKSSSVKIRKSGGGRKKLLDKHADLEPKLKSMLEPITRGDPESPLLWTSKSTYKLAESLKAQGVNVSQRSLCDVLVSLGYSLQSNKKTREGAQHQDRDQQFNYLYEKVNQFQSSGDPVISVDTKKKELIGNYKNEGKEYHPKKNPEQVNVHDFADKELGKVAPYGVYDQNHNSGFVNVGIDHDTAAFAVASITRWWKEMGEPLYPSAERLLITADCGGSNGYRNRLWKKELQQFASLNNISVHVSHYPPGTSKWNKIEHRMFSHITKNWRGKPLTSREVVVNLIANTRTKQGLTIKASLDENTYEKGIKVTDQELDKINLTRFDFHGEWNYKINP